MLRVLFAGENWYGSNARSCAEAFRRLGCQVFDVDQETFIPRASRLSSRLVRRLFWPRMVDELNDYVLKEAEHCRPDIFLAFKGVFFHASTLQSLSHMGMPLYNFFPDTSAFAYGRYLPKSLPEYDCIFYTKPFWYADTTKQIRLKGGQFLPHGYDPSLHKVVELDARDISDYQCDVSFIATHSHYKEDLLQGLIALRPELNLCIWGSGWKERSKAIELRRCIKGLPLVGERYVRAIQAARISLGIMNGPRAGASSGDLTTTRSYEIPASGGFMLHQRNAEVLDLYRENEEIGSFESIEELAHKIDYYLAHPIERESIAQAGHARCVPAYSYDNRMAEILRWHFEHYGTADAGIPAAEVEP